MIDFNHHIIVIHSSENTTQSRNRYVEVLSQQTTQCQCPFKTVNYPQTLSMHRTEKMNIYFYSLNYFIVERRIGWLDMNINLILLLFWAFSCAFNEMMYSISRIMKIDSIYWLFTWEMNLPKNPFPAQAISVHHVKCCIDPVEYSWIELKRFNCTFNVIRAREKNIQINEKMQCEQ